VNDADRLILWERPDGIPWLVAHWAARGSIAVTPAPPEWASLELIEAVEGALVASVEGFCGRCEAVRPAAGQGDEPGCADPPNVTAVPHADWCARSDATIARLTEACQPPGTRWVADLSDETAGRLRDYLDDLVMSMLQPPTADNGA
jgi:hypothetical protein